MLARETEIRRPRDREGPEERKGAIVGHHAGVLKQLGELCLGEYSVY